MAQLHETVGQHVLQEATKGAFEDWTLEAYLDVMNVSLAREMVAYDYRLVNNQLMRSPIDVPVVLPTCAGGCGQPEDLLTIRGRLADISGEPLNGPALLNIYRDLGATELGCTTFSKWRDLTTEADGTFTLEHVRQEIAGRFGLPRCLRLVSSDLLPIGGGSNDIPMLPASSPIARSAKKWLLVVGLLAAAALAALLRAAGYV